MRRRRGRALRRRYGHSRITRIVGARVRHYSDSGQTKAYVDWIDEKGKRGTTEGDPDGAHMQALLARATREGAPIAKETW
jgi:hypothetical protein